MKIGYSEARMPDAKYDLLFLMLECNKGCAGIVCGGLMHKVMCN